MVLYWCLPFVISKAHMDQVLAEAKVEVSPTSSLWEPQRAYERRLTSKDKEKGMATSNNNRI